MTEGRTEVGERLTWDILRDLARTQREVEDCGTSLKVGHKLLARLHQDGENVVVRIEKADRDRLIREKPHAFHVSPDYAGFPYVLVRLASASREDLAAALEGAWVSMGR